ncbi:hypothetical protein QP938_08625 [Porticoccaceae bacterium LTM1]|nr:hypothetical protein QP938_08625 [Porticoccaceae bacterium LTM1]
MTFAVEIELVSGDERLLTDLLKDFGLNVIKGDKDNLLIESPKTLQECSSNDLRDVVKEKISLIQKTSIQTLEVEVGSVIEFNEFGEKVGEHVFAELSGNATFNISAAGKITVHTSASPEEIARLEAAESEREFQKAYSVSATRLRAAQKHPVSLKVMEYLNMKPTPLNLFHAVEIMMKHMRGNLNELTSRRNLRRFLQSVNHPEVFHLEARHAVANNKKPDNPMTITEAEIFAKKLAEKWYEYLVNN